MTSSKDSNSSANGKIGHDPSRRRVRRWLVPFSALALGLGLFAPLGHAAAPPGRYTVAPTVVQDTKTGLVWQRDFDRDNIRTFAEATTYCAGVSLPGFGWRVPSIKELSTIVDDTAQVPSWDTSAFPTTDYDHTMFWSSTTNDVGEWYLWFYAGSAQVGRNANYVRCVR